VLTEGVLTIIQARMSSTRLPGKVLLPLGGRPVLEHVLDRARKTRLCGRVVVATTTSRSDDAVVGFCEKSGAEYFRGSELDVLDRFYQCARLHASNIILRLTADNPLVDTELLDKTVQLHFEYNADYVAFEGAPVGAIGETLSWRALEESWVEANDQQDREHVITFVRRHPDRFRVHLVPCPDSDWMVPDLRLTLDTIEDYARLQRLFETSGAGQPSVRELLRATSRNLLK